MVSEKLTNFALAFGEKQPEKVFNAEIAQLVEHNLAKVGVASSSLVFRSLMKSGFYSTLKAQVAKLVDAHVSGACAARRAGSIPVLGTKRLIERSTFFLLHISPASRKTISSTLTRSLFSQYLKRKFALPPPFAYLCGG